MIDLELLFFTKSQQVNKMAASILEQNPFAVFSLTASKSLTSARRQLASNHYNLILIHLNWAEGNAQKTLKTILELDHAAAIVVLTEEISEEQLLDNLQSGVHDIINISRGIPSDLGKSLFFALQRFENQRLLQKQVYELKTLFAAARQSPNIVMIIDWDGIVEYVNDEFEKSTGYSKVETIGQPIEALSFSENSLKYFKQMRKALQLKNRWKGQLRKKRKDGTFFWVQATINPIVNAEEKPTHFIASMEDISEQLHLQNELKHSNERLELSHEIAKLSSFEYSIKSKSIVHTSSNLLDVCHFDLKDWLFIGNPEIRLFKGQFESSTLLETCQRGERVSGVYYIASVNKYFELVLKPNFKGEEVITCLGTIQDITIRIEALTKAEDQRRWLQSILESTTDKIFIFDKDGNYVDFFSSSTKDEPVFARPELIGRNYKDILPKSIHRLIKKSIDHVVATGESKSIDYQLDVDGETAYFEASISRVEANASFVTLVVKNVTIENEIAKENIELVLSLQERVKEATCLKAVAELNTLDYSSIKFYFKNVLSLIPPGFLYPASTRARIIYKGEKYDFGDFRYRNIIRSNILLNGEVVGELLVAIPAKDNRGRVLEFLQEEYELIDSLADTISLFLTNYSNRQKLKESEEKYKGIVEGLSEGYMRFNEQGKVLELNKAGEEVLKRVDESQNYRKNIFSLIEGLKESASHESPNLGHKGSDYFKATSKDVHRVFRFNLRPHEGKNGKSYFDALFFDETEKYYLDRLRLANIKLLEASDQGIEVLIQTGIDEAVELIDSKAGFYHHVDEEKGVVKLVQWSKGEKKVYQKPNLVADYKISDAGIWVECIKSKMPVIHNDYNKLNTKEKLPEGHSAINRDVEVPILNAEGWVVAILGVGDKDTPYTSFDVEMLQAYANQFHALVEKKKLEQDHLETLENFHDSQEVGRIGSWRYDLVYGTSWWSDVMFDIYGIPRDGEVPVDDWIDYTHPDDRERQLRLLEDSVETGSYDCVYRLVRRDGELRYVYGKSKVVYDAEGNPVKHIGLLQDITDQKKAEINIQRQKEQFANIVSALPGIVYQVDRRGRIQYVSQAIEEMIGVKPTELLGKDFSITKRRSEMRFFHPDDVEGQIRIYEETFSSKDSFSNVHRLVKKNEDVVWVSHVGSFMETGHGGVIQGYLTDITRQLESEEMMMNAVMKASDGEKSRISKEIHDGLQQTLTIAALNLEFVKREHDKLSENAKAKFDLGWQFLKRGMEDSRSIAHRLMPKAIEDFGLVPVVRDMVEDLNKTAETVFEFVTNMDHDRIQLGAATIIYKLIQEAINNVLKHAKAKNVTVQYLKIGEHVQLIIEDDGVGFNPHTIEMKRGFGVASMRSRATALSADFSLDSTPGHGTTIILDFPLNHEMKYYE